jgi:hypothetical protein
MSQSDYIKYKKTSVQLKDLSNHPPILVPSDYTSFLNYNLENTITNTKINYHQLIPSNTQIIFNMEKIPTNCPSFITCFGTQGRTNRQLKTPIGTPKINKYTKFPNITPKYKIKCKCKNTKCICKIECDCPHPPI